jgi:MGT family glycosyltransferase
VTRFLTTVWPVPGHLHPNLAIGCALQARGHEVAFFSGQKARGLIEGERLGYFPFRQVDEGRVDELLRILGSPVTGLSDLARRRSLWQEWFVGTIPAQIADLTPILDTWRPDVIICDPAMWGPFLVLHETHRIPVAVFSYLAACILPGRDGPILGWPLPRPKRLLGRALVRGARLAIGLGSAAIPRAANDLRESLGLPRLRTKVAAYAGEMELYLQQSTREFDYNRTDLPSSVHYIGPVPWDRASNEAPPEFLSTLSRDRPWIYVTDGTMHLEPRVTRATLRALADLDVHVIATIGKGRDPAELGDVPANALIREWVPHTDLFPLCDLIVTTGGTGTVLKALASGVPLITVPTAWDQAENAYRLVDAGAGLRLAERDCTPRNVRAAVLRVLGDKSFRANAARVGATFKRYGGADQAADLLETLAQTKETPSQWIPQTSS